ncbi:hypothetical protein [Ralstonia pseudosolanacearum]
MNALDEEVRWLRADGALQEASRSAFHRWHVARADREDQVGDIAHDIKRDKDFRSRRRDSTNLSRIWKAKLETMYVERIPARAHSLRG